MPVQVDTKGVKWTYGAEHELGDWDTRKGLPKGFIRSPDHTIVNTNRIAAQPNPKVYYIGGEINTSPTPTIEEQVRCLETILGLHPRCVVNYRSNLHLHIRVMGLKDSLLHLKRLQRYIHDELPKVINLVEPIPLGVTKAEKVRERRRKVSHHTLLTGKRVANQLEAASIQEFFEREVPRSKAGKIMWHAQPRLAVNLRQLLQTDTIEFRHFPGTLSTEGLRVCLEWCRDFLLSAFRQEPIETLWGKYQEKRFPEFPAFNYETEVGYRATASHSELSQSEILENIRLILSGGFNASHPAYKKAAQRACGMSR